MNTLHIQSGDKRGEPRLSLAGALSAACLFAGIGGSLAGMFALPVSAMTLAVGLIAILLAFGLGRLRWGGLILGILAVAGMAAGFVIADFGGGLYSIINQISSVIGGHLGRNLARYSASDMGLEYVCGYLSALLALGCVWLVKNRCILVGMLAAALFALLDVWLGIRAPALYLGLMAAGVLLMNLSADSLNRGAKGSFLVWTSLAAVIALAVTGSLFLLEGREIPGAAELRSRALSAIREARFGGADSLPGGDFSGLGSLEQTDGVMLEVTMDRPESLYLRGFVGSDYTGGGWAEAAKASLSDGADLFYWLHQNGFFGQTQLAEAALLLDSELSAGDAISLSVEHVGASREYVYAPYELLSASDGLIDPAGIGDICADSRRFTGADGYQLAVLPNQVKRYTALLSLLSRAETAPDAALESYLINESHYNGFVYAHFVEIPQETRAMLSELLGEGAADGAHLDYGAAKQRILTWLQENVEYSEVIAPHAEDSDFLEEFLNQTRSGYDVHYATAAVMMMRYFGIPARYVEGYLVTPDAAETAEPNAAIALDGSCAHAWCEIYQDGIGWIPFEVAPKYLNLMEQADVLLAPEAADSPESLAPEQSPQQENSLDMEEDVYDDLDDEDEEDEEALPSGWSRIAGILLILLVMALLAILIRRWIAIARRRRALRLHDRKQAVVNLYAYLFDLMREIHGWPDCTAPSGFAATVRADLGEDAYLKYQETVRICEAAAFDLRGVLESDYRFVYAFVGKTAKLLSRRAGRIRRLYLRYMRNLI